ncbi:GNAT family N-acetyltransferase [Chitinophaga sp. ARDCPP14]|uniref:GNAT family N-acetyltransferase n=1 Tax=Chitinophaga sp. ARDCPP14 TaxID=3391139 RepID=UPI003F51D749
MNITTQRLTTHHLAEFIELLQVYEAVFDMQDFQMPDKSYLKNLLSGDYLIMYTAMHENAVIGGLTAYVLPSCYARAADIYVYDFAVHTEFQRKGVGKHLLSAFAEYCRENNYATFFVQAVATDVHAVEFYRATGGAPENVVQFTYTDIKQ